MTQNSERPKRDGSAAGKSNESRTSTASVDRAGERADEETVRLGGQELDGQELCGDDTVAVERSSTKANGAKANGAKAEGLSADLSGVNRSELISSPSKRLQTASVNAAAYASSHSVSAYSSSNASKTANNVATQEGISPPSDTTQSRFDLLSGDWTIFAPARDDRPNEFEPKKTLDQPNGTSQTAVVREAARGYRYRHLPPVETCPFCGGSESETPAAVWSGRTLDDPHSQELGYKIVHGEQDDWSVRVVPNKYPAVSSDATEERRSSADAFFPVETVSGGHEVFIESHGHAESLTQGDPADVYLLLAAYRDRIQHYRQDAGIKYISVFKNSGADAGASLSHSHSQLIATSILPSRIRLMVKRTRAHRAQSGCCLQCDLLRAELADGSRIVSHNNGLVAFCPFASRHPGTIRLTQTKHNAYFEDQSDGELESLSRMLVRLISWLESTFPGIAYNFFLQTCPPATQHANAFHWSLDLFPRLTKTAGFEWSSDCIINPLLPETAAASYRQRAAESDPRFVLP